ncbi:MAG: hypothetical protein ACRETM_08540, partial [Stenotrophobium sp.]
MPSVFSRSWRILAASSLLLLASGCSRSASMAAPDFADLVEAVNPSVVNISAVTDVPATPQKTTLNAPGDGGDADNGPDSEKLPEWFKKYFAE